MEKNKNVKKKKKTPAPTASAIGPCPTAIQIVGRPATESLPRTTVPPTPPPPPPRLLDDNYLYQVLHYRKKLKTKMK